MLNHFSFVCLFLSHLGTVQVSGCWFRSAELQTTQSFQRTNPKDRNILYAIEPWGQFYRLCIFGVPVLCSFYQRYDVFSAQMYVICTTLSLSLSLSLSHTHTSNKDVCVCVCVCVCGGGDLTAQGLVWDTSRGRLQCGRDPPPHQKVPWGQYEW